ncbi:MFS transporter [Sphingomonas sp. BN140010]|uniref:MFS transporter n=1 Tax=Sphingomonas arvum TaxID=2992113 RepID=A0ABT3JCV0_9SPHN|nr:MFS transporter [Sphingomonas sp. BN140010]MCW3796897.1 MFS transporter [Sphingomonas sp. BN140010]
MPHNTATSRLSVLAYGGLALPLATIGLPLTIYLAPFYAGEIGLPLAALGTAMLLARLADIITDPIIGTLSDRWRPRMGRRRVWLLIGVPVLLMGMMQLFNPPKGVGLGFFLLWLAVMYVGFTMTRLPYFAWGGELSSEYHQRTRIAATRQTFSIAGLVVSTLVPAVILSRPGAKGGDVLSALSWTLLILLPLAAGLLFFLVPEPAPMPDERRVALRAGIKAMWRNGPFKRILLILLLGYIAETFRQTITVFFARDVIGVPNIGSVYVIYFIAGLIAVPFWRWFGRRVGKHRALAIAFTIVLLTNAALFFLSHGQTMLFTAIFIIKGLSFGALELLPAAMVADTADVDTVISKEERQGMFFAAMGIAVNIGQAAGQFLSLNMLSLVGYNAAGETGTTELLWLRAFYALMPGILLVGCILLCLRYPLNARRHDAIRAYLDRRRTAVLTTELGTATAA